MKIISWPWTAAIFLLRCMALLLIFAWAAMGLITDKVTGRESLFNYRMIPILLLVVLSGCTWKVVPTPFGNAWSVRFLDWTKTDEFAMDYVEGTNAASINFKGLETRADSEGIEAGGTATGNIIGAAARKGLTGQ